MPQGEQAFLALRHDWDLLWQESRDATHFQLWDWQYLYWKHVLPHSNPEFVTLRDSDGKLLAVILTLRARSAETGLPVTEFAGGLRSDHNMFLVAPGLPASAGTDLLGAFMRRNRRMAPSIVLRNIPAHSWTAGLLAKELPPSRFGHGLAEVTHDDSYGLPLPATVEEYVVGLSPRSRRHFGYERRRLAREAEVKFLVRQGTEDFDKTISDIEKIDKNRWGSESIYSRSERGSFERSLIRALAEKDLLLTFLLYVNGNPASFAWGAVVRGVMEISRIAYDPTFPAQLSVGKVANFYTVEECIKRGYVEFNLGRGQEVYKSWLGAKPNKLVTYRIYRSRLDRNIQLWATKLGKAVHKHKWIRDFYRKYVQG